MPPGGYRTTSQRQASDQRPGASRNEAFENIFGRPAVGHHLGPNPGPSAPGPPQPSAGHPNQGYGYGGYAPANGNAYISPVQPSLPPSPHAFAAPPPRGASHFAQAGYPSHSPAPQPGYPQRAPFEGSSSGHGRPAPAPYNSGLAVQDTLPDRRASLAPSLAPSTYSTHSQSSYYSPQPDPSSPPTASVSTGRPPAAPYISHPQPARQLDYESRPANAPGRLAVQTNGQSLSAGYRSTSPYDALASPASAVFPRRSAPSPAAGPPNSSANAGSGSSANRSPSFTYGDRGSSSRSPVNRTSESADRLMSPPPDYVKAMGNLGSDSQGNSPLDSIPNFPNRGESLDLSELKYRFSQSEDQLARPISQSSSHQRQPEDRYSTRSNSTQPPMHRRMASDSSISSIHNTIGRNHVTPLSQIDQSPGSRNSMYDSPSTPTSSDVGGFAVHAARRVSNRKSMDSTLSLPPLLDSNGVGLPPGAAASSSIFETRATSFSGSSSSRKEVLSVVRSGSIGHGAANRPSAPPSSYALSTPHQSQRSLSETLTRSASAKAAALRAMPHIYPALLSRVAEAFKQFISLSELIKDGITYKDAFDGRAAVAIIADIIKTPDRNLALLLGRALDAQKLFHDVTYDHRLRDNPNEIYQFKERLTAPYINDNPVTGSPMSDHAHLHRSQSGRARPPALPYTSDSISIQTSDSATSFFASVNATPSTSSTSLTQTSASPQLMTKMHFGNSVAVGLPFVDDGADPEDDLPVGVFTLLTDCYSPTCSRDSLCYSINCPRRLEQMKRLNMKPQPGLTRKLSSESLHEVKETGTLWIHSVSQEVLDSVDDTEKKRQEAINEVIYTERDFVRDLEYLRDSWVKPLRTQEVIPSDRRNEFVQQVFWNVHDVLTVNHPLAERLTKRQKQQPVVKAIGDLFLERVPQFEPFVQYGSHQLFGKYEFEKEKGANPAFQRFVDETERRPESRKLELNGYLTKPTTRLGRYPLLLEAVLKYTPDGHPDKRDLPEAIKMIRGLLTKVNIESGKAENVFELAQIESQLVFRQNETIDLRLKDKSRELVHKGPLKRRGGNRDEIADLIGFLFDHAFLLVKPKHMSKGEQLRVYRRPIPLELLVIVTPDEQYNATKLSGGRAKLIARPSANSKIGSGSHVPPKPESKHGFSITIIHLGKKGYSLQLWVDTFVSRKKWLEAIDKQQGILRDRSCVFTSETITEGYFGGLRKINCLSPYDNGNRMIYGTDEGVYFSNLRDDKLREPVRVINLLDVTQVDVIEEYQLLIVLHERSVTSFPLDCLDPSDPNAALKRAKRIASHTSFFKSGVCLGKMLLAVVKSSTLSSTIKVLEPIDQTMRGKKPQTSFMKRLNGGNEALKLFKEFYIPTESSSVHFLKTKLCVGCTKGFEIVDLETLDMQGLLDPSDSSLDFVLKRDNVRPIAIYRIEEDFLLCYDEFAFYVNKNGWRARPKWAIIWEGVPTAFALQYPYVIAFEPTFVEIHHVETGHLVQIIPGNNISCSFADTPPSRVNAPVPPPNRQLMYPPQSTNQFRPPTFNSRPSYPAYGAQPGFPPGQGMIRPPQPMPAQPQQAAYGMPPMPVIPRFARPQVIFTSEDGHVQFLKYSPAPTVSSTARPPVSMPGHRMSH